MRRILFVIVSLALPLWEAAVQASTVVDFEDIDLPASGFLNAASNPAAAGFPSRGSLFHWSYSAQWGTSAGFAASNISDTANYNDSEPWNHPYNSITGGGGNGSSNYAVAFASPSAMADIPGDPFSIQVTNNTYAYYSMQEGDPFAKKFGGTSGADPDWFRLTVEGFDSAGELVGSVDAYLADFRAAAPHADYILDTWQTVDLTDLVGARRLEFSLASSDTGEFGMNTPAYVAIDNLVLAPACDLTRDTDCNAADLDRLAELQLGMIPPGYPDLLLKRADANQDGRIDFADRRLYVEAHGILFGDANLDGAFDSTDLILVFQAGTYEKAAAAGWASGDWSGDQRFDSGDLILAFQQGVYERQAAAVPEPASLVLTLVCLCSWIGPSRRTKMRGRQLVSGTPPNGCFHHTVGRFERVSNAR